MDYYTKFGGISKMPGTLRFSDTAGSTWMSLHYFEYFNLASVNTREILGLNGSVLYRIESDQTLTSLKTGLTSEPLLGVSEDYKLFLCSENNSPIKYDGDSVTAWGVKAPGQTESVLEAFSTATGWTTNGTNSLGSTTAGWEGNGLAINKTDTAVLTATATKSSLTIDASSAGAGLGYFLLFIPAGGVSKLATSGTAVSLLVGTSGTTNTNTYTFSIGELVEGWNLLSFTWASADSVGGAGATLSNITDMIITLTFSGTSATKSGFVVDHLYVTDNPYPTGAASAGSGITTGSVLTYRVTFVSKYGQESNAGTASGSVTVSGSNLRVSLTSIPVSSDTQVVARRIYRDLNSDATYRYVTQIDDNVTTTYTDSTGTSSLSKQTPPRAGASVDNSPPNEMTTCALWSGFIFGVDASNRFRLVFSDFATPESFPVNNFNDLDEDITALVPTLDTLLVFTTDSIYQVSGGTTGARSLTFIKVNTTKGCSGVKAVVPWNNFVIAWHDKGPYVTSNGVDSWDLGVAIQDQIDALNPALFSTIHAVENVARQQVLFFVPSSSGDYDTIFCLTIGIGSKGTVAEDGTGIDPQDPRNGFWSKIVLPASNNPRSSCSAESALDTPITLFGCDDGVVYKMNQENEDFAVGSLSSAINSQVETTYVLMGNQIDSRGTPRYLLVNGEGDAASTWTYTVTTAKQIDSEQETVATGTFVLAAGNTSKKISLPSGNYGAAVKVKLANAVAGETATIRLLALQFIPRTSRGVR